jgi:hypothetical protein
MTQKILHYSQVSATFEQVGGETVAQCVRKGCQSPGDCSPESPGVEGTTAGTHEEGSSGPIAGKLGATSVEISLEGTLGRSPDRDASRLSTFTDRNHDVASKRVERERRHLRDPEASGIEELHYRCVPETNRF